MKTTKTSSWSRAVCLLTCLFSSLKKNPSQVLRTSPYLQFKPTWIETEISTMFYRQVSDLTTHWLLFLERKMCYMSQANYCTLEEKENRQTDRKTKKNPRREIWTEIVKIEKHYAYMIIIDLHEIDTKNPKCRGGQTNKQKRRPCHMEGKENKTKTLSLDTGEYNVLLSIRRFRLTSSSSWSRGAIVSSRCLLCLSLSNEQNLSLLRAPSRHSCVLCWAWETQFGPS
jgi:hypothetical protein